MEDAPGWGRRYGVMGQALRRWRGQLVTSAEVKRAQANEPNSRA
jgi:hypothetical protein